MFTQYFLSITTGSEIVPRKSGCVNSPFGKKLIKYRKLCGFTQKEIADILNINRTTYTKYETGVSEPNFETLRKIVAIFGVDVNTVLGQESFAGKISEVEMPMSDLADDERELVGIYRVLSSDEKQRLMDNARKTYLINKTIDKKI